MRLAEAAQSESEPMAEVKLVNVKKIYPFISGEEKKKSKKKKDDEPVKEKANLQITDKGVVAVQEFNLDIADKEFIVLVGPSGCGKSTTLRMIAGLEEITEGELYIDGKLVNDVAPKDRDIAMVFQNYALYPHMTVYDNMAFSLKLKKVPKAEIDRKVKEAAEILDITQYLDRKPKALSGGEGQIDVLQHLARPARALGASDDKVCRQGRVALFHVADSDFVHVRVLVSFSALYYTNCAAKVQPGAQKRGAPQAARPEFIKIKDLRRGSSPFPCRRSASGPGGRST